jgi:GNAT superfamily N-acetyltransferase
VQAHGRVTRIDDPAAKARVLTALMAKHQPEGGFEPLHPECPLYANMLEYLLIFGVVIERLEGKRKLGQNRSPKQLAQIVERLWQRGAPGDDRAIEALLEANPSVPVPAFLQAPCGLRLHCALDERSLASAVELLADEYWNRGLAREVVAQAHRGASAWVGASDAAGRLVATARAVSDGAKFAYLADVAVARERRGSGVGQALVRLLLDHPAVRGANAVRLGTADATEFYRRFGFTETSQVRRSFTSIDMLLLR